MNDDNIAVKVQHLTKSFKIPTEPHSGIKQKIINTLKGRSGYREFTPLNDISFDIKKGDFFGIVGRNGSGKSTLLKSIAGIYEPNSGGVKVNGKLIPFIELGVGFNPELSGRENVFLNGALLGFSNKEMQAMYDEIVDFAELHDFMDERLKNYSSGMQVRLAFSIAIRAEGDILLLDEVLAVGDEVFQRKCYSYFDDLRRNKKTVILVTHDMRAVERYCSKALFLDGGQIVSIDTPYKIAEMYSRANEKKDTKESVSVGGITTNTSSSRVKVLDKNGKEKSVFSFGEEVVVRVTWDDPDIKHIGVAILRRDGEYIFGTNTYQEKVTLKKKSVDYTFKATLYNEDYFVKVGLFGENDADKIDFIQQGPIFSVNKEYGVGEWGGITKLEYRWDG